jgi:hypothetical protein
MLWPFVAVFAVGACVIVYSFALGVGLRKFVPAVVLFLVGVALVGGSMLAGTRLNNSRHGVTVYEAPELEHPAR